MDLFSDIKVYPTSSDTGVVGRGSFVIGNAVKVNFTLYNGRNGIFVMLPSEKDKNGKVDPKTKKPVYYPHASFISATAREQLNTLAIQKYNEAKGNIPSTESEVSSYFEDNLPF